MVKGLKLKSLSSFRGCSCEEGCSGLHYRKVFRSNKLKVLALNRTLNEYFRLVKWCISFSSKSKSFLYKNGYEKAKELFNPNTV